MIDFWNIEESGVGNLLENMGYEAASINGGMILIFAGICFLFLSGVIATWSLHRALRRSEERLAERLIHQIHHELLSQQETQMARMAIAAGYGSPKHRTELTNRVDEGLQKRKVDEDESIEKLLSSMRRFKGQHLEVN